MAKTKPPPKKPRGPRQKQVPLYESADGIVLTVTEKSNLRSKRKGDAEENGEE
jgi:hypothetical protein